MFWGNVLLFKDTFLMAWCFFMCIDIVINSLRRKMRPSTWCLMEVFICR
jgi:hypothetical protein